MRTCPNCLAPIAENGSFCARCGEAAQPADGSADQSALNPAAVETATAPGAVGAPGTLTAPKTSPMAIAGFILSLIPCLLNVIGVILGAIAMSQIKKRPQELKGHGLALAAVIIGSLWLVATPVVGILSAIAIPNFVKFQSRSKQAEAKASLKAIHTASRSYEQEKDSLPADFQEMGFVPDAQRRYGYFFAQDAIHPTLGGPYALPEYLPEGTQAAAVGNIDGDETLDVWVMDETGTLTNTINDVME